MRDYRKIEAWRLADDLTVAVYGRTRSFREKKFTDSRANYAELLIRFQPTSWRAASRESKKDYLHFLYIARGSLSEVQYFVHLARRLGYLSSEETDALQQQTKTTFACLHGLIRAVEKEAGKLSKVVATVTSLIVIGLMRWSGGQLSVVA